MRRLVGLLALVFAVPGGALLGLCAHAAILLFIKPTLGLQDVLEAPWDPTRKALVGGGVLLAVLLTAQAARLVRVRAVLRDTAGALLGAGAGFFLATLGLLAQKAAAYGGAFAILKMFETLHTLTVAQLGGAILGSLVGVVVLRFGWRFYGVIAYVAFVSVVAGYFAYVFNVALPRVPVESLPFSLLLLWAEGVSLLMVVVHTFYGLDNFVKRRWNRTPGQVPFSRNYLPKVAFHYAMFNEPTELVFDALSRFKDLDYPKDRFVVMVCDDSTDETLRKPVEQYCRENGFVYLHRTDRRGYKAGALNNALRLTPDDVELISVVDADYHIEPEYLKETVGYFIDPGLGFIQTPQDYRNVHQSFLTEQYYYADGFFYRAMMPSRNEANAIIFCGTMGMLRKEALARAGGWAENHVTEDAELSVRLLSGRWRSLYIPKTFGKGLIPPTFDAYVKQHHRWAFGGVKVLKAHFGKIFGGTLGTRQRFDFAVSGVHWFDGVYACIIAAAVGAIAYGEIMGEPLTVYHRNEIFLVGLVPVFLLLDGFARLHLALRRALNLSLMGTVKVMGVWYAIKFVHMRAALKSLIGVKMPFVRTPKAPGGRPTAWQSLSRALLLTPFETACFLALSALWVALPVSHVLAHGHPWMPLPKLLLWFWLSLYAVIFLAAPLYAYKSYRSYIPDEELPTLAVGFRLKPAAP
jgi:cellulose synthase/poly-beta-1,6-N-acetylglucosamine synthase-like glycosyltransferase